MAGAVPDDLQPTADALQRLIQSLQLKADAREQMPLQPPWRWTTAAGWPTAGASCCRCRWR
jgi:hypothetical protein